MNRNHGTTPNVTVNLEETELVHVINALSMADDLDDNETTPLITYLQNKLAAHRAHQVKLKKRIKAAKDARSNTATVETRTGWADALAP